MWGDMGRIGLRWRLGNTRRPAHDSVMGAADPGYRRAVQVTDWKCAAL